MKNLFIFITAIAITISPPALAQTKDDFWQEVRVQWGAYATKDNVTLHQADVTCDGVVDFIGYRVNLDNPDGPFFDLLVLTRYEEDLITELISLPFTGSWEQYGLCGHPERNPPPQVSIETWSKKEVREMLGQPACTRAIAVVDGMCDTPRFFWAGEGHNGHFVFFRH